MSDFVGAALGTGFTCLMTVLGAACVCFFPGNRLAHFRKGMMGFAAGIMMAASVFSLLLPAIEQATRLGSVPWLVTGGGLLLGVALIVWMGRFLDEKMNVRWNRDHRRTVLLVLAVTLHNIPEGMAVGLSFALAGSGVEQFAAAAALALGIGIQNFPEGAAISLPLYQEGMKRRTAFAAGALSGVVEPLFGMGMVLLAPWLEAWLPWLLSAAAGAMLVVVIQELLPAAITEKQPLSGTLFTIFGFWVMMLLDVALG